jgi:hypothetical protein
MNKKTKWLPCGQGTLNHPITNRALTTEVVELDGHGRIFEVFHYNNEPEQTQRLIVAAPQLLAVCQELKTMLAEMSDREELSEQEDELYIRLREAIGGAT